jgi:predicted aconitase with swiveling domain
MHRGCFELKLKGRKIYKGLVKGEVLVTSQSISFYGGVDPETGNVVEKDHELEGKNISGKVLVFPTGKGSTVGSYTLYRLKKEGKAPAAIVNKKCDTIIAVGCIISEIACIDQIEIEKIPSEAIVEVNADNGILEITTSSRS